MTIQQLLELTITKNASDLHMSVAFPPTLRIHGELWPVLGEGPISPEQMDAAVLSILSPIQKDLFRENMELDFSLELKGKGRFRVNLFRQKGTPALSFRLIPANIPILSELGFPKVVEKIPTLKQGFVLVTGPTGHGKSTTLASFINQINQSRAEHILTIEDPIEYVYPIGKSLIDQREMFLDTKSWNNALKASLREDPNVVLIGELRDLETMSSAMTIAETGHLVFATLHTNSAAQSIDRIIDVFPEIQQPQIRLQLASTLEAILSIRLIPSMSVGRTMVSEVLFANPAIRNIIREGKTYLIDNVIETSAESGMQILEKSLADMVKLGKISEETAIRYALRPQLLAKLLR